MKISYFIGVHLEKHSDHTSSDYRLQRCLETYEKGLTEICIGNKSALWSIYLDFLIDCYYGPEQTINLDKKMLLSALERSSECTKLSDRYFVIWAQLLNDESQVMAIIQKGENYRS